MAYSWHYQMDWKGFVTKSYRRFGLLLDIPWLRYSWVLPGYTNLNELRIFALKRSGHHAIANWIRYQVKGRYCFLNNCTGARNPFSSCVPHQSKVASWLTEHNRLFWDRERAGKLSKKGTLIYNFEDENLEEICNSQFEAERDKWVGKSKTRTDVIILRDPYNWLASRLRWAYGEKFAPSLNSFEDAIQLWKEYANEFLDNTSFLTNKVPISYNHWFLDRKYRRELAMRLSLRFTDAGLNEVAKWGPNVWGDSFDGLRFDGKAQKMKVFDRWRQFAADELYLELVNDGELAELSMLIFGETEAQAKLPSLS